MPVHTIKSELFIPAPLPEVWRFFSHAANLQAITPEYMRFRVTSGDLPDEIYPGQIITYKVSPVLNIPLFWMTEITHVIPQKMFVDTQLRGPYRLWHHQHHFETRDGGTFMTDLVHYQLPLGFLGSIAHALFVKKQVASIFTYREAKINRLFRE